MLMPERKEKHMDRITFGEKLIASGGYDAQMAVMEIEFTQTRRVIQYVGVSEEIWYGLKASYFPDRYFQQNIRGKYEERSF